MAGHAWVYGWLLALLLVCPGMAGEARSDAAEDGPPNAVGVAGEDGLLDYGSPEVEQELHDDRTFVIRYFSKDEEYGYTIEKPIMVGNGGNAMDGPKNEQRYLNMLAGPNGESIRYVRRGSGHMFKTKHGFRGESGMLDIYKVTYPGLEEPVVLYLNMYDSDTLKVPVGFSRRFDPPEK